ncbi:MAG: hypothetical protein U1C97_01345 [Candidatus Gracilibacteria bacterium]|nr:hypothetical protein [Candidatus Gracilibacteria bacterium]
MKQITWGKFAEKIMSYILAEAAYDNKKNIKVIRVGKKIDLRGVDLFIERKLKDGWKLFGIDFKMKTEPKKGEIEEEGEDGKKDQEIATYNGEILRTVAKELHFNPQIARKVSNSKLFMERTPELEVVEVEDLPRREFYNDLSLDFRVELLKEIYERITSGNMPDINDQKFFRKAYDDTYQNLLNWKGRDFLKKYTKQSHEIINFAFGRAA